MSKIPCCLDCGTKLSQEPWAPELCPRCSLQLALEQSPVEMDVEEDPEALPTREFPGQSLSPGQNLARSLVPEFSGDTEATKELLSIETLDVALSIMRRWRQRHGEVLVIVDQFEELFTLNSLEVQSRFAELLGGMAVESDVRVLISMRDDFFLRCHEHRSLAPIFSEPTPLHAPTGAALRRALVQPALKCGYRFEEESLVEEMIAEVREERGALPLLAFAAAQLWERRDRKQGLLTRESYAYTGGVGGALAQHAEATLEKIGNDRLPIVRELFRNLVTSEGTRADRDRKELLSVFGDREQAEEVLGELISARLLTSFELADEGDEDHHHIEIVHESLLAAWPRLVRWQTQDADSAQLRDQLRQAARLWEGRDRSQDLLWTGTAFQEFQLWRDRYPGGLTQVEEEFGKAMVAKAERQKKRRRRVVTTVAATLLFGLILMGTLWQRAEQARRVAEVETRRAEAGKLLALGQIELDDNPTAAVAYAIASLELADSPEARVFALGALQKGPIAIIMSWPQPTGGETFAMRTAFSPDGAWFALAGFGGNGRLWSADGQVNKLFSGHQAEPDWPKVRFGQNSDLLLSGAGSTIRFWSVPEMEKLRTLEFEKRTMFEEPIGPKLLTFTDTGEGQVEGPYRYMLQSRPLEGGKPSVLGYFEADVVSVAPTGKWLAYSISQDLYVVPTEELATAPPRLVGRHEEPIRDFNWTSDGERIASIGESGEIRIWSIAPGSTKPLRIFEKTDAKAWTRFNPDGSFLAAKSSEKYSWIQPVGDFWCPDHQGSSGWCLWKKESPGRW